MEQVASTRISTPTKNFMFMATLLLLLLCINSRRAEFVPGSFQKYVTLRKRLLRPTPAPGAGAGESLFHCGRDASLRVATYARFAQHDISKRPMARLSERG